MRGFFIDSIWAPAPRLAALSAGHRAIRSILVSLGSLRSPHSTKDAAAIAGAKHTIDRKRCAQIQFGFGIDHKLYAAPTGLIWVLLFSR
jgi:hypothetical protein